MGRDAPGTAELQLGFDPTDTILPIWGSCARVQVTTEHVPIYLAVPH